jgi:hypothetical protein
MSRLDRLRADNFARLQRQRRYATLYAGGLRLVAEFIEEIRRHHPAASADIDARAAIRQCRPNAAVGPWCRRDTLRANSCGRAAMSTFPPSVEVCRLFERVSAKGTNYIAGRLGRARISLLPGAPAEDGTPTWRLLVSQAPEHDVSADNRPVMAARKRPAPAPYQLERPRASSDQLPSDPLDDLWRDDDGTP